MDLSHIVFDDCRMTRRQGGVTIVAVGRWRPPWSGCIFLPSFRLVNCASMPDNSKTNPITNRSPTIYLGQKWSNEDV